MALRIEHEDRVLFDTLEEHFQTPLLLGEAFLERDAVVGGLTVGGKDLGHLALPAAEGFLLLGAENEYAVLAHGQDLPSDLRRFFPDEEPFPDLHPRPEGVDGAFEEGPALQLAGLHSEGANVAEGPPALDGHRDEQLALLVPDVSDG